MAQYRVDAPRAVVILDRQAEAEALVDTLAGAAGDDWGGAWLDPEDGVTMHVGVSSDAAAARIARNKPPRWVVVQRVGRSLSDLRKLRDEARRDLGGQVDHALGGLPSNKAEAERQRNAADNWTSLIDVATNSVRFTFSRGTVLATVAAAKRGSLADRAILIEVVDRVGTTSNDACPTSSCWASGGGLDLANNAGAVVCSTGFTFIRNGAAKVSTADHCTGTPWSHGGTAIGGTEWTAQAASYDAKMITINNPGVWKATNLVYRGNAGDQRSISSKISTPDNSLQGISICHSGIGLQSNGFPRESCGTVTSIDGQTGTFPFLDWDGMGVASYNQCRGDSGGAVYNPASGRAYGLVRGRGGTDSTCGGGEAMFSWVSNVEAASGSSVMLAAPQMLHRNLKAQVSGKCLDVRDVATNNGAIMQQYDCLGAGQLNQVFDLVPVVTLAEGTYYRVTAIHKPGGLCLDIAGPSTAEGAYAQGWDCFLPNNQQFLMKATGNGFSWIPRNAPGKCVDVQWAATTNMARVWQWGCSGSPAQIWTVYQV